MKNKLSNLTDDNRAETQLNVVLLCESNKSRKHGVDIATYIQKRFHHQSTLACHLWRWDGLASSRCRKAAARQVVGADLVIIASDGRQTLPASMIEWMGLWSDRPRARDVLVLGTVPAEHQQSPAWLENLRTITREMEGRANEPLFVTHDGVRTTNAGPMIDQPNRLAGFGDEVLSHISAILAAANGAARADVSALRAT